MNRGLFDLVAGQLEGSDGLAAEAGRLVRAACVDEPSLRRALEELDWVVPPPTADSRENEAGPLGLRRLSVAGLRGIGPEVALHLSPGPGLTLIAGRNGSGKSSLAEALELLLYGDLSRWGGKSLEWKKGWANIHAEGPVFVEAELVVDGRPEPLVVRREWSGSLGAKPGPGTLSARYGSTVVEHTGLPNETQRALYRPILSYGDLGRRLENKPSELFDDVAGMLGLDALTGATKRLETARRARKKRYDDLRATAERLRGRLREIDDDRAAEVLAALAGDPWDLGAIREVVQGRGESATELSRLQHVAGLEIPSPDEWTQKCEALERALAARDALSGTAASESLELARLLEQALALHEHAGDTERCPVCEREGGLDATWRERAGARIRAADESARLAKETIGRLESARSDLAKLCRFLDRGDIEVAESLGLSTAARDGWARWWREDTMEAGALLEHVRARVDDACGTAREAVELATEELRRRNEAWSATAEQLEAWLVDARRSLEQDDAGTLDRLKLAEDWLRDREARLREERFRPIADRARSLWERMRQDSNVSLDSVSLAAKGGSHRRLELAADVDATGKTHPALALMSQGELNVLALSLFLPRVLLDETPFHFVVLDDPVQAMDPHKVDGLARVLDEVARSRQVIVFTHDPRLRAAVDRLGIEATVLSVTRQSHSRVEIEERGSPTESYIQQAYRMLEPGNAAAIGETRLRRIVPSACRMALEAALQKVAHRRLLADGSTHADAERKLENARATVGLGAIALFGDPRRGDEVYPELEGRFPHVAAAYRVAVEYAHKPYDGDLKAVVGDTRRLAQLIEEMR